jgi:putative acetyltransferase
MPSVRPERPEDRQTIHQINQAAFEGEVEARLVDNLRGTPGFIPELSLVAESDGRVVGHILFSIVHIQSDAGRTPVLALAPMAVTPERQNEGIGSLLVREGLERCKALGYGAVILVGHANYYPRFGFTPAGERGIRLPFEAPDEAFMALELVPGALKGVTGMVEYPPEFNEE